MSDLSKLNPTGRFDGLADLYARYRPTYPDTALDRIMGYAGLSRGSLMIDVGCGTGISSRLFAMRGLKVIGIEPNDDMRARAEAEPTPDEAMPPEYRSGRAEATGLPDGCADVVLCAQSFHWFDAAAALQEFQRVLRFGGAVALMWNERDESDPFTAAYGGVIRTSREAAKIELPRGTAGEPLLHSPLFRDAVREVFPSAQTLDEEGVLGRASSASYAPKQSENAALFRQKLRDVFAAFQRDGRVTLRYETSLYLARSVRNAKR